MLRRAALVVFLLLMSGAAALLAANHFGIPLPWDIAVTTPETAPQEAKAPAAPAREDAAPSAAATEPSEKSATAEAGKAVEETVAALAPATGAAEPAPGSVAIDISRVSPDGTSVFAGRAEPDTYVTLLEDGKPAGTVKADQNGDFSLATEHKFASADPKLTFETSKTAPAPPEPPAPPPAAAPATAPEAPATASAANDVMRKFEKLVADAREEASRQREAAARQTEPAAAPAPQEPAKPETPVVESAPERSAASPAPSEEPAASRAAEPGAATSGGMPPGRETHEAAAPAAPEAPKAEVAEAAPAKATAAAAGPTVIPVPIMFVYNEAKLTPEGERAASLLLEYLTLKHLDAIELTGHADERGTHEYNMDLSRDRLETVSALLRRGGYSGDLKLTPKGKTEPYRGVDRTAYTGEALFQLDRRVELRIAR